MTIVGIDVGKSGSLCLLSNTTEFVDFKTFELRGYIEKLNSTTIDFAVVELVHSMPSQGVKSMFSFGENYGSIQGALQALDIPYILVRPKEWQRALNIPSKSDKKQIASIIQKLFPKASLHTERGRLLDGRSDALCLAHYGQLYLQGKK